MIEVSLHPFLLLVVVTDVDDVVVVRVVVGGNVAVVITIPVVVRLALGVVVNGGCLSEKKKGNDMCLLFL
jgi:hypothetical protein